MLRFYRILPTELNFANAFYLEEQREDLLTPSHAPVVTYGFVGFVYGFLYCVLYTVLVVYWFLQWHCQFVFDS